VLPGSEDSLNGCDSNSKKTLENLRPLYICKYVHGHKKIIIWGNHGSPQGRGRGYKVTHLNPSRCSSCVARVPLIVLSCSSSNLPAFSLCLAQRYCARVSVKVVQLTPTPITVSLNMVNMLVIQLAKRIVYGKNETGLQCRQRPQLASNFIRFPLNSHLDLSSRTD
jgi:hypothetical protein